MSYQLNPFLNPALKVYFRGEGTGKGRSDAYAGPGTKEFGSPLSLVPGRKPLSPWDVLSDECPRYPRCVPAPPYILIYAHDGPQDGAGDARETMWGSKPVIASPSMGKGTRQ